MMKRIEPTREERAHTIAQFGELERVTTNLFYVHSQTSNKVYSVQQISGQWTCECPDHTYRGVECKHIIAVKTAISEGCSLVEAQ